MKVPPRERMALLTASSYLESLAPCLIESDVTADTLSDVLLRGAAKAAIFLENTQSAPYASNLSCPPKPKTFLLKA